VGVHVRLISITLEGYISGAPAPRTVSMRNGYREDSVARLVHKESGEDKVSETFRYIVDTIDAGRARQLPHRMTLIAESHDASSSVS